jgi:nucleotide-binding universal stress UspA family protein
MIVYPGIAMYIPAETIEDFSLSQQREAKKIEMIFRNQMKNESFACEWRLLKADSVTASDRMVESARSADLVIMSQDASSGQRYDYREAQEKVIRASGRPVLVIPRDYKVDAIGSNILLGWSGTREATRAAHDLISVSYKNANVGILRVGENTQDELLDSSANEMAATYAHHGLKPAVIHRTNQQGSIAKVLLHEAFEMGADLLVTGAYGHSRTYDFVIGAATQEVLETAKLPVLFSK